MSAALQVAKPTKFMTFNLGHLIQIIVFVIGAAAVYGSMTKANEQRDTSIGALEAKMIILDAMDGTLQAATMETAKDIAVIKNDMSWIRQNMEKK